jgi:hypothetical protein
LINKQEVLAISKACLQRIHRLCIALHGDEVLVRPLPLPEVKVRVFLSAYMIAYRPSHVFGAIDTPARRLMEATTPMLAVFHRILDYLSKEEYAFCKVPRALTKAFPRLFAAYMETFKTWKVQICSMRAYVE